MSPVKFTVIFVTTVIVITIICCLFQKDKPSLSFIIKEYLPSTIEAFGLLSAGLAIILLESISEADAKQKKFEKDNEPYQDPKGSLNYRGEYCDKYKSNWY